jgi:hypothetical protein
VDARLERSDGLGARLGTDRAPAGEGLALRSAWDADRYQRPHSPQQLRRRDRDRDAELSVASSPRRSLAY